MSNLRAQVLDRLLAVLKRIDGIEAVYDNQLVADDAKLPALVLIDGETEANEGDFRAGRPATAPVRMTASPIVVLIVGGEAAEIRSRRETFYARIVKAVLSDADLVALTGSDPRGEIRHVRTATSLRQGREIYGDMQIDFEFGYWLKPNEL